VKKKVNLTIKAKFYDVAESIKYWIRISNGGFICENER